MFPTSNILEIVYEIQGNADPNHPDASLKERMAKIWELACQIMDQTGFIPD